MPAELSLYSLNFIDRVILLRYVGAVELGLYALAFKFSQAIQVVVRGFQLAWPPLAYSIRDDDEARRAVDVRPQRGAALAGRLRLVIEVHVVVPQRAAAAIGSRTNTGIRRVVVVDSPPASVAVSTSSR